MKWVDLFDLGQRRVFVFKLVDAGTHVQSLPESIKFRYFVNAFFGFIYKSLSITLGTHGTSKLYGQSCQNLNKEEGGGRIGT